MENKWQAILQQNYIELINNKILYTNIYINRNLNAIIISLALSTQLNFNITTRSEDLINMHSTFTYLTNL